MMIGSIVDGAFVLVTGRPGPRMPRGVAYLARRPDGWLVVGVRGLAWPEHGWITRHGQELRPEEVGLAWYRFARLCGFIITTR